MHTNNKKKTKDTRFYVVQQKLTSTERTRTQLTLWKKAYIHGAHPHSTHTMKSMNTTVKNYHTILTISHFSTWHSTPHIDTYNEKTI